MERGPRGTPTRARAARCRADATGGPADDRPGDQRRDRRPVLRPGPDGGDVIRRRRGSIPACTSARRPFGYVCYANPSGSAVIPASSTTPLRVTTYDRSPLPHFTSSTVTIDGVSHVLGTGNPRDSHVAWGVKMQLVSEAADNSTAVLSFLSDPEVVGGGPARQPAIAPTRRPRVRPSRSDPFATVWGEDGVTPGPRYRYAGRGKGEARTGQGPVPWPRRYGHGADRPYTTYEIAACCFPLPGAGRRTRG